MIGLGVRLGWKIGPLEALARWPRGQRVLMLHSGRLHPRWSRYSILAQPAGAYRFDLTGPHQGQSRWIGSGTNQPPDLPPIANWSHRLFNDLDAVLAADPDAMWIGYLAYDAGRLIERLPTQAAADRSWPIAQMHRCPGWLVYDGLERAWYACGTWRNGGVPNLPDLPLSAGHFHAQAPHSDWTPQSYQAAVERTKAYIAAGDVFQVNLAQRFTASCTGDPRRLYLALASASPAWYGAYLELEPADADEPQRVIASASPELFLEVQPSGCVITRPIKGTRPATALPQELLASEKDAAELNMIVDLLRNDLGRVCAYGTVQVAQAREIESHPTVHHGVATIRGQLHPSKTLADLLRATMPGGSITGAPKVRAMQIIDELEPVRRGPYCGAAGYVHGKQACFNIIIRTLLIETGPDGAGRVDFSVGGGIVADSDPASEYQETLDKAAALRAALEQAT